jgi:XTP/dITP diphosphohydrolase
MDLVLATRNLHKLRELEALLAPHRLLALPDGIELPPEDGASFEENALIKARAAVAATGSPVIADDSGIAVTALGGEPGIHSARYAGPEATDEENLAKLIAAMDGAADRRAAYVCVLALARPDGQPEVTFEGRCEGVLTAAPRGEGGFGYDPIFVADEHAGDGRTMAELTPAAKDSISHRGRAARKLAAWLEGVT